MVKLKKKTGLRFTPALAKALQAMKGKHSKPAKTFKPLWFKERTIDL